MGNQKHLTVLLRAIGNLPVSAVTVADQIAPFQFEGAPRADERYVRLKAAADLYSPIVLREALGWLCQEYGGRRIPFSRLNGRPVNLLWKDEGMPVAAYISNGTFYLLDSGGCRW